MSVRWQRLEAATWVHRLLVLQVVVLVLLTAVTAIGGLAVGAPLMWLLPAALAAVAGWLAGAWDEGRRWSWWAVMALTALSTGSELLDLASRLSWRVAWLLVDAVVLVLLAHPDSTARLDRRAARPVEPRWAPGRPVRR